MAFQIVQSFVYDIDSKTSKQYRMRSNFREMKLLRMADFHIVVVSIFADPPLILPDLNFVSLQMKFFREKSKGTAVLLHDSYSFDGHLGHCTRAQPKFL